MPCRVLKALLLAFVASAAWAQPKPSAARRRSLQSHLESFAMTLNRCLVLLALALAAGSALAQPKPALVQDRDEPGRNPFQERVTSSFCEGAPACILSLGTAVPAGKRLVVTQIAVALRVTDGSGAVRASLNTSGGGFSLPFAITGADANRYALLPMTRYFEAGQMPLLTFGVENGNFIQSQEYALVGYLIDAP